jgi:acyl-CoA thioester hydrolase
VSRHRYLCHVRFSDVDVYGHVNNVKYFEYFQEARIAFILALADPDPNPDPDAHAEPGLRQVVARIDVDYKRPILFRPEPYVVETWATRVGTSSYDLHARIVDDPAGSTVYSTAQVRLVAFDPSVQRSRPLSTDERARLERAIADAGEA